MILRNSGAAPRLVRALSDRRDDVRLAATRALPRVGADPGLAIPALRELLDDPNDTLRLEAAAALRRLSRPTPPARPE